MNDFSKQLRSILINFLKVDKINLIGFSLGALIALDFASKFQDRLKTLTLYLVLPIEELEEQRNLVIDRFEQAKLNKPISKQALKRWFSNEYLSMTIQKFMINL
jgi:pimeloyl-ACP methyl ester carboxylesterase